MKKALFKLQSARSVYKQQQKLIYTSFQWNNFVKSGKLFGKLIIVFLSDYQFLTGKEKNHIKKNIAKQFVYIKSNQPCCI